MSESLADLRKQMLAGLSAAEQDESYEDAEVDAMEQPEEQPEPAAVQVEDTADSDESDAVDAEQADSNDDQELTRDVPKGYIPIREYRKTARQLSGAEKTRLKLESEIQALKDQLAYAEKRGIDVPKPPTEINYAAISEGDPDAMREAIELQQRRLDAFNQQPTANYLVDPNAYSEQEHAFFNMVDQAPANHPIHEIAEWIDAGAQRGNTPANDTYAKLASAAIRIEQQLLADPQYAALDDETRAHEVVKRAKASVYNPSPSRSVPSSSPSQPAAPTRAATPRSLSAQGGVVGNGVTPKGAELNDFLGLSPEEMMKKMRELPASQRDKLWSQIGLG